VDDPERVGVVRQLGIDETTCLSATRSHPTIYPTSLVDPEARVLDTGGGCVEGAGRAPTDPGARAEPGDVPGAKFLGRG
jgi:hypothetical protein